MSAKTPTEVFGENVFSDVVMQERLPKAVYASLRRTIDHRRPLDPAVADVVATAMKDWAIAKGATHFTHVFYPLTGLTAEKHDSFLKPDGRGGAIAAFSGDMLIQSEPDASSFPSGGLRSTFEARGYTAWDVTSPAYVLQAPYGTVLCIPSVFISWSGEALDKKTPLLRSLMALDAQARRVLNFFGTKTSLPVLSNVGPEQEYFLIDRKYALARPDLLVAGRTLFGAKPAKGQEFEDQYFGAIPARVLEFMSEVDEELCRLGVPVKTRHNEVAPSQYEIAPIHEAANPATDHNQLVMQVLKSVAERHDLFCLLHEKPFAGINGSGKHLNYSIGNRELGSLFDPGETPEENAQFLIFCAAAIRAVHKYGGMLRATVASASNDHRLGANEAPPAIMSVYLGEQLSGILERIAAGNAGGSEAKKTMHIGVDTLPDLSRDPGDRNRTSPFAFTGNRFEFRAVGSSMSIAGPQVALNTMMADSLDRLATALEAAVEGKPLTRESRNAAVQSVLHEILSKHGDVVFNGDGYADAWKVEAARRGLPNLETTPEALPTLTSPEVMDLFTRYGVFDKAELLSRQDIYLEQYSKTIRTEAKLAIGMARTLILPAALRYQDSLASGGAGKAAAPGAYRARLVGELEERINALALAADSLERLLEEENGNPLDEAKRLCAAVLPLMDEARSHADALESRIAADVWPLPGYQEMLFVK